MHWLMLVLLLAVPGRCQREDDVAPVGGKEESAAEGNPADEGKTAEQGSSSGEGPTAQEETTAEDDGAAAQEASSEGASDSARPEQTSSGDADDYSADDLTASVTESETELPAAKAPMAQEAAPPKATEDGLAVQAAKRIRGPRRKAAAKKVEAAVARIAQPPLPTAVPRLPAAQQFLPVPPTPFAPYNP